jgi:hypothetical protein
MDSSMYYYNVLQPLIARNAKSALEYTARGNEFNPQLHIIVGDDFDSQEAARVTLQKFGDLAMVVHVQLDLGVSLQIQFSPLMAGNPVGFYNALPETMPVGTGSMIRSASDIVPLGFSGFIHIPSGAKSWANILPTPKKLPFGLKEAQAKVGGNIEVYGTKFRGENCDIYCNEMGKLMGLPVNALATAFVAEHRPDLYTQLVGDVLLTFRQCCEARAAHAISGRA